MRTAKQTRIFIGVPTFNRPDMVRETVESLRASLMTDFIAVISDNVSSPDTAASVETYVSALNDPRFRFVGQPLNEGEYGQGRYFFAEATKSGADYFMILHDDDLLDPTYLDRAIQALASEVDAALFIANPRLIDECGAVSAKLTAQYLSEHGRNGHAGGLFPILETVLCTGFAPISGTVFRLSELVRSGFVDADCAGNFPFELNVLLRLGDLGLQGWFDTDTLISVRYHEGSLRNTLGLMGNRTVVETMLTLLERRSYHGIAERRRQTIISRLYRARAEIALENGHIAAAKADAKAACRVYPKSLAAWKTRLLTSMRSI